MEGETFTHHSAPTEDARLDIRPTDFVIVFSVKKDLHLNPPKSTGPDKIGNLFLQKETLNKSLSLIYQT